MQKVEARVRIAGHGFALDRSTVEQAMQGQEGEPLRDHFVVVGGRRFPPKQVIARVTGLDRADFTTNQARAVLRRLGFTADRIQRVQAEQSSPRRQESAEADELRPYRGSFVATKDRRVLTAANTPQEVYAWLERHDRYADSMFRVPVDPTVDIGGFPS